VSSPKEGHQFVKKDMKYKIVAKKWLDGRVMAKNFNNNNSGEFGAKY